MHRSKTAFPPRLRMLGLTALAAVAAVGSIPSQTQQARQFAPLRHPGLPAAAYTHAVVAGDVDGDGDVDLVVANSGQNQLALNDGTGRFWDATGSRLPADADSSPTIALGDVDGDGDPDLVIGNSSAQDRLYLNDGSGAFSDATATRMPVDSEWTACVALGDLDGDGDLDIVLAGSAPNRIYLNDGSGTFTDATASRLPAPHGATTAVLGDVDGDGDLDLILGTTGGPGPDQNRLYLNDGAGSFADATGTGMPAFRDRTYSLALGDVDRDGDLDLVVGNSWSVGPASSSGGSVQNRLCLNDGSGTFVDATASRMPTDSDATHSIALGDLDGDGDLDIVCGNGAPSGLISYPERNRIYLNDGAGSFVDATIPRMPVGTDLTAAIAIADLDGDRDLDLVVGNVGWGPAAENRILVNLQRQLSAPFAPQVGQAYTLEAYSRYGPPSLFDVALPFLSTARTAVSLPPYGTLGIQPMLELPPMLIPRASGLASVTWNVPNAQPLVGVELFAQALFVAWPSDARLSNVTSDAIR